MNGGRWVEGEGRGECICPSRLLLTYFAPRRRAAGIAQTYTQRGLLPQETKQTYRPPARLRRLHVSPSCFMLRSVAFQNRKFGNLRTFRRRKFHLGLGDREERFRRLLNMGYRL